jgi:hypothetical protein
MASSYAVGGVSDREAKLRLKFLFSILLLGYFLMGQIKNKKYMACPLVFSRISKPECKIFQIFQKIIKMNIFEKVEVAFLFFHSRKLKKKVSKICHAGLDYICSESFIGKLKRVTTNYCFSLTVSDEAK